MADNQKNQNQEQGGQQGGNQGQQGNQVRLGTSRTASVPRAVSSRVTSSRATPQQGSQGNKPGQGQGGNR
jgi:hypothetical protein